MTEYSGNKGRKPRRDETKAVDAEALAAVLAAKLSDVYKTRASQRLWLATSLLLRWAILCLASPMSNAAVLGAVSQLLLIVHLIGTRTWPNSHRLMQESEHLLRLRYRAPRPQRAETVDPHTAGVELEIAILAYSRRIQYRLKKIRRILGINWDDRPSHWARTCIMAAVEALFTVLSPRPPIADELDEIDDNVWNDIDRLDAAHQEDRLNSVVELAELMFAVVFPDGDPDSPNPPRMSPEQLRGFAGDLLRIRNRVVLGELEFHTAEFEEDMVTALGCLWGL